MLKFSYVGMESKTVKVGKENELNVKLSSSLTELDEVVVVGYGTQKKVNLTGAVQSVSGQELIRKSTSNLSTATPGNGSPLSSVTIPLTVDCAIAIDGSMKKSSKKNNKFLATPFLLE